MITDPQELFDRCAVHLLRQGRRSVILSGIACAYRGTGGLKCAIGVVIPDDRYVTTLEGLSAEEVNDTLRLWSPNLHGLARLLQCLHDGVNPGNWREELRAIAKERGLNTEAINAMGASK